MIFGSHRMIDDEDGDDSYLHRDLQKIDLEEIQRREAGWIILEGLIYLGN